jgi:hypothetical protein
MAKCMQLHHTRVIARTNTSKCTTNWALKTPQGMLLVLLLLLRTWRGCCSQCRWLGLLGWCQLQAGCGLTHQLALQRIS